MDQKAEHYPFIGLRQGVIGEPDEGAADKIIPLRPGMQGEFDRPGAVEKSTHLWQCFDVVIIHDGIHPSIMNRTQAISVSSRVRNTAPVQYHLVLEEAAGCQAGKSSVYLKSGPTAVGPGGWPPWHVSGHQLAGRREITMTTKKNMDSVTRLLEQIKKSRGDIKPHHELMAHLDFEFLAGHEQMMGAARAADSPLPLKTRELILFAASVAMDAQASTVAHCQMARDAGATDAELLAAVELVTLVSTAKPIYLGIGAILEKAK